MTTMRLAAGVGSLLVVFGLDRFMKWWALYRLPENGEWAIQRRLGFVLGTNEGISYSLPIPHTFLLIALIVIIVVLVFAAVVSFRRQNLSVVLALAGITVGACSNLLDRLKYGYVVDYATVTGWPVFNLADVLILAGAIWLVIRLVRLPAVR